MKNIFNLAAFVLSCIFFSQVNALPGKFCPEEQALRTEIFNHLASLASQQPLTLKIRSKDRQVRNWEVSDAQFYPNVGTDENALPLQESDLLMDTLGAIVTQNRILIDYDMAKVTEVEQKKFGLREQQQTWFLVQIPYPNPPVNAFVFTLSESEAEQF
ncbi:MAG: hypothetical protein ACRCTK_04505 [Alphaproteobacteria bacterium]